jgi:hypothetical protein
MAKRSGPKSPSVKLELSAEGIKQGIARLSARLEELTAFDPMKMQEGSPPELRALETAIERAVEKTFGEGTADCGRFSAASKLRYSQMFLTIGGPPTPLSDYQAGVSRNRLKSLALLGEAIRTLKEDLAELGDFGTSEQVIIHRQIPEYSKRIFIVHGHDDGTLAIVQNFIEKLGFEPVVLHLRPNKGRTIITKFQEESAGIGFAVVLMTPDDHGAKAGEPTRARARQNVVFELGFFYGALGAARVAALVKGDVEHPSDFDGVIYIPMDREWKTILGRELREAGFEIDWNKVHE